MTGPDRSKIRFRGREETVLETIHVRGRRYEVLANLSSRGGYRVFDKSAAPGGDYRALYRISKKEMTAQRTEILRRLSEQNANQNFPQLVQFDHRRGEVFVVLSWVHGTNLNALMQAIRTGKAPSPSVPEVVRLMRGLAHGLGHFHRRTNLIHGDVSPANIVLTSGPTKLVLVDFGSAWAVETSATKPLGDGVTLPYSAPERLARHAVEDFRSDVFSMSVVAYELLTLAIPYDGLGGQAGLPKFVQLAGKSYQAPSAQLRNRNRLPRDAVQCLDRYFDRALALHPDERFGTRTEWVAAWDELQQAFKKGDRLTFGQRLLLRIVESVEQWYSRPKT